MTEEKLFLVVEGFSVFGEPLVQLPLMPEIFEKQKELFDKALMEFETDPANPDNIIWLGRRTAYLGRYRDAITIFTRGIKQHPQDARMYRHRGHRFITLRLFKLAIDDFTKAAHLIQGKPDEIEPDGMPNPRGIPVSTLHFNIWYHLGLAYYLEGDLENALNAYQKCMKVSDLDDKYVATAHWLYMTLRLLGRNKEAEEILRRANKEMDIIENHHYHECLLMYKGEKSPKDLMKITRKQGAFGLATIGYGVANWYNYNNRKKEAASILREIISLKNWASFGYIAAEVDLKRMEVIL